MIMRYAIIIYILIALAISIYNCRDCKFSYFEFGWKSATWQATTSIPINTLITEKHLKKAKNFPPFSFIGQSKNDFVDHYAKIPIPIGSDLNDENTGEHPIYPNLDNDELSLINIDNWREDLVLLNAGSKVRVCEKQDKCSNQFVVEYLIKSINKDNDGKTNESIFIATRTHQIPNLIPSTTPLSIQVIPPKNSTTDSKPK